MPRAGDQYRLFDVGGSLPNGFVYRPDFITKKEEAELLGYIEDLPFEHPVQEGYPANRRVINFGWSYDFNTGALIPGPPLPPFLRLVARRIAKWLDIPAARVAEALITEYTPGSAIGWHRDNESFEHVIGVSLAGWCLLRLRPISSKVNGPRAAKDILSLGVEPRSAYLMQNESRWNYQHSVPKTRTLRYSITFRTLPKSVRLPKR